MIQSDGPPTDASINLVRTWRLDRVSERRSLTLSACGVLVGLIIAGTSLFTAQGTRTSNVPPEDVALVNGANILMSDYITQLHAIHSNVPLERITLVQKRKVLDDMIREELLVQRGIELGLQNDVIEVRNALVEGVTGRQAIDILAAVPTEAEMRSFYASHADLFATQGVIEVKDYIAPDKVSAAAAAKDLRRRNSPSEVVARYRLKSGAIQDGADFYFAAKIHLGETLFAVARTLPAGAISDPIPTNGAIHVLAIVSNSQPVPQPYDAVKSQVLEQVRKEKLSQVRDGTDRFLRERADVQVARDFE